MRDEEENEPEKKSEEENEPEEKADEEAEKRSNRLSYISANTIYVYK